MKSPSSQGKCSQCRKTWREVNSSFGTSSNPFGFVKIFVSGEERSASDNRAKDVLGSEKLHPSIKEAADRLLESNERLLEEIARVKVHASNSTLPPPLFSLCTSLASPTTSLSPLFPPSLFPLPAPTLSPPSPSQLNSFVCPLSPLSCLPAISGWHQDIESKAWG